MNRIRHALLAATLAIAAAPTMAQDAISKGLTGDRAVPAFDCSKAAKGTKDCMTQPRMKRAKRMKQSAKTNDSLGAVKADDTKR